MIKNKKDQLKRRIENKFEKKQGYKTKKLTYKSLSLIFRSFILEIDSFELECSPVS